MLEEIYKRVLEIDQFTDDITMENTSEWTSLKHLRLLSTIESEFNIKIELKDMMDMTSVGSIRGVLKKYVKKFDASSNDG